MIIPRCPYPPTDGALLVINDRIKLLKKIGHEVVCFIIKGNSLEMQNKGVEYSLTDEIIFSKWNPVNNRVSVFRNCFFLRIPPLVSYYFNSSVLKELEHLIRINDFKYVSIDHLHLSYYGILLHKKLPDICFVLFHHNIESDLYYSFMNKAKLLLKPYFYINGFLTGFYEKKIYKFYEKNIFISKTDLNKAKNISTYKFDGSYIACTVDIDKYKHFSVKKTSLNRAINIGFIGSMDYSPNIEGVGWFIDKVIPLLDSNGLKYTFYIIGKNPPNYLYDLAKNNDNIKITGWVDDDVFYYQKMDLIVCPIFFGAGVKIKMLNALSCGKIILATSKAVEGIDGLVSGIHYLKSDIPKEFFDNIFNFYDCNVKLENEKMALSARKFILDYSKHSENILKEVFK